MAKMEPLAGQLLIASPTLSDYFERAVVLVLAHGEEGAMGVVLNRPSELDVADAVPVLADLVSDDDMVYLGGPVSPRSVVALGEFDDPAEAATAVVGPVGVVDPEKVDASVGRLRVFAGYAGWAPSQLEAELEEEAWFVAPARPEDLFVDEDLWPIALRRKGGAFALLARMPADPSLN
ncbi:MAG: YqgE/AlgH family protein [Actinomycetota bacterium]|nr:YqgE/AlgH family protein [Actinomycetota bacterium]